ncbi:ERV/ALR sulfhydryl oxidase domain-containing protein [Haematococcus lacustris]
MGRTPSTVPAPGSGEATAKGGATEGSPGLPTFPSDCRACDGAQSMLASFARMSRKAARAPDTSSDASRDSSNSSSAQGSAASSSTVAAAVSEGSDRGGFSDPPTASDETVSASADRPAGPGTSSSGLGCPPDTLQLGRASWTFLHSLAAYYPAEPSLSQRSLMRSMMEGLAEFYPCHYCAAHLQQQIQERPPDVTSNTALSQWLCVIHNEVNELLGKPAFDCSRVMERWRQGPSDGSCG